MLTLPCNCVINTNFGSRIIAPTRRSCPTDDGDGTTTKLHLTNLHLLKNRIDEEKYSHYFPSSEYNEDAVTGTQFNFDTVTRDYIESEEVVEADLATLQVNAYRLRQKTLQERQDVGDLEFQYQLRTAGTSVFCLIIVGVCF
ncbi:hypothetical protein DPMN_056440 [Dreissena polymorpha]|uniref:Uncharacterized protein n=1 Tax=Dreissena polymorpha TaxID=45954 RepID=A0A9D4HRI3_DREPO|nr:hypothetical protein DPMN_056440 [Dreissena polymorpha]